MRLPLYKLRFALPIAFCLCTGLLSANNITICKTSSATLTGTTFHFTVADHSGVYSVPVDVIAGGPCVTLHDVLDPPNNGVSPFTIRESASASSTFTGAIVTGGSPFTVDLSTRTVTVTVLSASIVTVTFNNAAGNQGCTPGFYKQTQHFSSWGSIKQTATVSSIGIGGAVASLEAESLLDALQGAGGSTLADAEAILLRAAVAAYLNARIGSGVSYPLSQAQIITAVNGALATGDRDTILALASSLDSLNNGPGGCPLS
jgi:hypothetical protein